MQDGQFSISPNTRFEDLLKESDFGHLASLSNTMNVSPRTKGEALDALNSSLSGIQGIKESPLAPKQISPFDIDVSGRYPKQSLGWDNEDLYAQGQGFWNKAANGVLKGLATAGSTFLQGTVGLVGGIGEWATTGKFSKVYDNDLSNALNDWTHGLENTLPNYYTAKERAANWYEPANIFTANFLFDKIIKNLGYSLGAIYSGSAMAGALKALRYAIPMAKDAAALGKLSTVLEDGLQQIPQVERLGFASNAIKQAAQATKSFITSKRADRLLVSTLGAFTESGLESLQNTNQYRDGLIDTYTKENGVSPTGEALESINQEAAKVGNASFKLNMTLLTFTNYIQ
jgi:hypothetical protein